jgi:hypothetical protein
VDRGKRLAFANDPLNLLSVDAHVNRAKGDGDGPRFARGLGSDGYHADKAGPRAAAGRAGLARSGELES